VGGKRNNLTSGKNFPELNRSQRKSAKKKKFGGGGATTRKPIEKPFSQKKKKGPSQE